MPEQQFLIADIGGTNIRLASCGSDPRQRHHEITYRLNPATKQPFTVEEALADYLGHCPHPFAAACLGVAGRVSRNQVELTNRPDVVRRKDIARSLSIEEPRVLLVNDMPPHLAAVDKLLRSELIEIKRGTGDPAGSRAILMPGTGVGTGGSVSVPGRGHLPFPSEGGHIDFAPRDEQQDQLLRFLRPLAVSLDVGTVSNEFVFAGEGIRRIYAFLQNPDATTIDAPKSEEITTAATTGNLPADDLRRRTTELYLKILGAAAANLAMMFTATGGVYLGGSICLSLRKFLGTKVFLDAFTNSGPPAHGSFMEEVPVYLLDYKDTGLLGAGVLAQSLL
jgi:glucokinase